MNKNFFFILILIFLLTGCSGKNGDYIILINNNPVGISEYKFYLYLQKKAFEEREGEKIWNADFDGDSAENSAKLRAYESLVLIKLSVFEAQRMEILLTEDEEKQAKEDAEFFIKDNPPEVIKKIGLTDDEVFEIMKESQLYYKLYDTITERFVVNFENNENFEEYYNNLSKEDSDSIDIYAEYIFLKSRTEDEANKVYLDILENSFEIISESYPFEKSGGIISPEEFGEEITSILQNLDVNEVSPPIRANDGYYIFYIESIENRTSSISREEAMENYLSQQRNLFFQSEYERWQQETIFEINKDVWDQVSINDFPSEN